MRLEVTRKSDLAVQALQALAAADERLKGPALAGIVGTTAGFVSQVMTPLVRAGWARSDPGPSGGYSLVVDVAEISVLSVIEVIEGPTDAGRCVLADRTCAAGGICALHVPWQRARQSLRAELGSVSVADAVAVTRPLETIDETNIRNEGGHVT